MKGDIINVSQNHKDSEGGKSHTMLYLESMIMQVTDNQFKQYR